MSGCLNGMRGVHAPSSIAAPPLQICSLLTQLEHWGFRQLSSSAGANISADQHPVLALLQEELAALSIPSGELKSLASTGLSDAALTAWTLTKTSGHAAADKAAAASQRLQYLLTKLDGAAMRQQAAGTSPAAELLWKVALAAARQQLQGMSREELEACVEYRAAHAAFKSSRGSSQPQAALHLLQQQLPQFVDTSPRTTLAHPAFWQLAQAAASSSPGLSQDLSLLGYSLDAAAAEATQQLQQAQQLLGLDFAQLQQQLLAELKASINILQPEQQQQLLQAVSGSAAARGLLAQLQLVEVLAACCGLSAVQIRLTPSSIELVRRLTGRGAAPAVSEQLAGAISAAAPALQAAVRQLPASSLAQPGVTGLLQLLDSKPELQALHKALTAWRAQAAAAGSLPVLTTLTQSEVSGLSKAQADAVGRHIMQLEAQGRLLLRQAAAGQLDLAGLSAGEADALAWKVHTGGAQAAEELVELVLVQAAAITSQHEDAADAAEGALAALSAGFELEEAASRRSTAAPPSQYVMAGIPQLQIEELSQGALPAAEGETQDSKLPSTRSRRSSAARLDSAERLVRDLALLLAAPAGEGLAAAVTRLNVVAHDLPRVLSGPLLDLLAAFQSGAVTDASSLRQRQQQLQTFLQVLAAELPQQLQVQEAGSSESSWASSGGVRSADVAGGLVELLGEQDSGEVLQYAADKEKAAADRAASRRRSYGREGGAEEEEEDEGHLYDWLANIHHDQDMQRYLQIEFEPSLDVDVVHAPRGWRDPDLFISGPEFLDAMRPLLDTYLEAQGKKPLQDIEWQVHRDAALAEAEQVEAEAAARRHAAGHSPFNNSRADEAFLRERLQAGIPKDSVLYASAYKYLSASFHNRSWNFAQRKRMVDVLIRIADHLAAHPPRSHRGSPFSALFQDDGPPLVPRISQQPAQQAEAYALPPGFGGTAAAGITAPTSH